MKKSDENRMSNPGTTGRVKAAHTLARRRHLPQALLGGAAVILLALSSCAGRYVASRTEDAAGVGARTEAAALSDTTSLASQLHGDVTSALGVEKKASEAPSLVREVADGKRRVASAAWWGYNWKDATEALQRALRSDAEIILVPDMGRPWEIGPVSFAGNKTVVFEPGVVVEAKEGAFRPTESAMFSAANLDNLVVYGYGATIRMRRADYEGSLYQRSSTRHAMVLSGLRDSAVIGLTIEEAGGDGILIGPSDRRFVSRNVTVQDVTARKNSRQGITVVSGENIAIDHCEISQNASRLRDAGLSFEPADALNKLIDCTVTHTAVVRGVGSGIRAALSELDETSDPVSITVKDSVSAGNTVSLAVTARTGARGVITVTGTELNGPKRLKPAAELEVNIE